MSANDLLGHVVRDHAEIKQLMESVRLSSGPARRQAFERLVRKIVAHETAEQEFVHPLLRGDLAGGTEARLTEEKASETLLAELEDMGPDDPAFEARFEEFRTAVLDHATQEENEEHPRIAAKVNPQRLRQLAVLFDAAQKVAPTHPHPTSPTSALGNFAVGPVVAFMDRGRDLAREARRRLGR